MTPSQGTTTARIHGPAGERWVLVDVLEPEFPVAADLKDRAARERFGPEWVGDPPLVELYAELLDARNYARHAWHRGELRNDEARELLRRINELGASVRMVLRRRIAAGELEGGQRCSIAAQITPSPSGGGS